MRKITIAGVKETKVLSDSYLYDKDPRGVNTMVYCSMIGVKTHVDWAALELRKTVSSTNDRGFLIESPGGSSYIDFSNNSHPYRVWGSKTPGEKYHAIYLLEDAIFHRLSPLGFYLIGDNIEECKRKFFGYVSRYSAPLHPSWSGLLWTAMVDEMEVVSRLRGYNKVGYKVDVEEEELLELVSKKIASGVFCIPEEVWKGEYVCRVT